MIKRISKFGLVHQSYSIQAAMRIQVYNIIFPIVFTEFSYQTFYLIAVLVAEGNN